LKKKEEKWTKKENHAKDVFTKKICFIQKKSNIFNFEKVFKKLELLYEIAISLC
jgi:hypothetical protein